MTNRVTGKTITALFAACLIAFQAPAFEWPNPKDLRKLPVEITEVPSLADSEFMGRVAQTEASMRENRTDKTNFEERANVARMYYNALQSEGYLVPGFALIITNALQSYSGVPDEAFGGFAWYFDNSFLALCKQHSFERELGPNALGRLEIDAPKDLTVREYTTIVATYRVGKVHLKPGARIRFGGNWQNDMSPIQFTRAKRMGYTTVRSGNPSAKFASGMDLWPGLFGSLPPPGFPKPKLTLLEGELKTGDTVTFVLGDTSGGGPGLLLQSGAIDAFNLRFEIDPDGTDQWIPVAEPMFVVKGSAPHHIRVVAPTTVRPGQKFSVRACVEDRYGNRAVGPPRSLRLFFDGEELASTRSVKSDKAVFHFDGLGLSGGQLTPVVYEVQDGSETLYGVSNPVHLIGPDEAHVYWGDLHAHEGFTDGAGTAEWVMDYAKNVAFLDYCTLTGHDLMMSELHQREVQRVTNAYHEPHNFVTFKSYEWSMLYIFGGHHNVYYLDTTQRVIPTNEARSLPDLYRMQREINSPDKVLIIPHCHEPADWHFTDAQMERLVEIYSMHGTFEWFGERYLRQGYHLGLIAASDDHSGHPGNSPARKNQKGGLAAVFAGELTREAVFDGLKRRSVYGTSLARIYLKTMVEGAAMGEEIEVARKATPSIEVKGMVSGTAPIARIVVVLNGHEAEVLDLLADNDDARKSAGYAGTSRQGPYSIRGGEAAIRVMITNTTDPGGDAVLPPLERETWWGRITLGKTLISDMVPIGLDGPGDTFVRTGSKRVDFACTMKGDKDGALIKLAGWTPDDTLKIQIFSAPLELRRHVTWPLPLWGDNVTTPVETFKIPLGELGDGGQSLSFSERGSLTVERVANENLSPYQDFDILLTENVKPDGENYVYVRVEQIDGEAAWSSPVWVTWKE